MTVRPLLAAITTGTSAGLVAVAAGERVGLVRVVAVHVGGHRCGRRCRAVANLRTTPRLPGRHDGVDQGDVSRASVSRPSMSGPLTYAALYFAATTAYLTYAGDTDLSGGLGASAAAMVFALVGVGGIVGLRTSRLTGAFGAAAVARGSVCVVGAALVLLALGARH